MASIGELGAIHGNTSDVHERLVTNESRAVEALVDEHLAAGELRDLAHRRTAASDDAAARVLRDEILSRERYGRVQNQPLDLDLGSLCVYC